MKHGKKQKSRPLAGTGFPAAGRSNPAFHSWISGLVCSDSLVVQLFLDPCGLAGALTQVVQLGATDVTATLHFDAGHQRGVGLEGTLNAFAGGDLPDDESGVQTTVALGDDHAFVSLQTLTVAFLNLHLNDHGVT